MTSDKPLEGKYVVLATPSHDDRYAGCYVSSLINAKKALEHFGAGFRWFLYPKCSDLCHARNMIHEFFATCEEATHLMMIDSDMGWDYHDIIRMLMLNRDFVAGVGCKKKIPAEWCAGNFDETTGEVLPLLAQILEDGTILAHPMTVGGAFVMISKMCALRMRQAYPELKYSCRGHDNMDVYALYDPVILPSGDRFFDDFAYCHRWRKIRGTINVLPDILLKHEGSHTFEGKWSDSAVIQTIEGGYVSTDAT